MPFTREKPKPLMRACSVICLAIVGCSKPQPQSAAALPQPAAAPSSASTADSPSAPNGRMPNPQFSIGAPEQDEEAQMGQEVFEELKAKGEIIATSPLYAELQPIADAITRAAQPRYNHPFRFYLVHEAQPNAFATPGGNVYVVDSLLSFVKGREELSGTLCHEVSHTIHHDAVHLMAKRDGLRKREVGAAILLGPTRAHILAIALAGKLHSLGYSREMESQADITGSDVCARAGSNPWGLVWLFQDFQKARPDQVPELLSDHPGDQNRIDVLQEHFRDNPSVFARFSSDPKSATPLPMPKDVSETFLH